MMTSGLRSPYLWRLKRKLPLIFITNLKPLCVLVFDQKGDLRQNLLRAAHGCLPSANRDAALAARIAAFTCSECEPKTAMISRPTIYDLKPLHLGVVKSPLTLRTHQP